MSSETAHKPFARTRASAAIAPVTTVHESRARFRAAVRPGRRSLAAGLDSLDVSEGHEDARRSDSRRRERSFVEHADEERSDDRRRR